MLNLMCFVCKLRNKKFHGSSNKQAGCYCKHLNNVHETTLLRGFREFTLQVKVFLTTKHLRTPGIDH